MALFLMRNISVPIALSIAGIDRISPLNSNALYKNSLLIRLGSEMNSF